MVPVIAIDGPNAAGKGTLARGLASELGWHLLDSGALYRIVAMQALEAGIALQDADAVAGCVSGMGELSFALSDSSSAASVLLDSRDITAVLRTEAVGSAASLVAALAQVRVALLGLQRSFRIPPGLVADGRDMGTRVFVDADLKIYLVASVEARAQRRLQSQREHGHLNAAERAATIRTLIRDLQHRDERDQARTMDPLRMADDAVCIDSTELDPTETLEQALRLWRKRL